MNWMPSASVALVRFGGAAIMSQLDLGCLTPPIGMNLFPASCRFGRPMVEICRSALPFLVVLPLVVLLITHVPWLTLMSVEG